MNNRALITGASSGIGLSLAREFAKNGHSLIISAPVEEELEDVAERIRQTYGVEVTPIAADLMNENAPQDLFDEIQNYDLEVNTLVNNAGLGQRGLFSDIPLEREIDMIRLNIEAVVRMTKLFLHPMLERGSGQILNTASVAGFEPGPMLAVYHASKAFVLSFTEALAIEVEDSDITVTALCPGPTDTDFFPKAGMTRTRVFQKGSLMAPSEVAAMGYNALMNGDRICVTGGLNKAMVASRRLMTIPAQARMNKKFYENVEPSKKNRRRGDLKNVTTEEEWRGSKRR